MTANRHHNHRDLVEPAIRAVLHKAGVQTFLLTGEAGVPDLLCLLQNKLFLLEVKRDSKAPLRDAQAQFKLKMDRNHAPYYIVWDADTALEALRLEMQR